MNDNSGSWSECEEDTQHKPFLTTTKSHTGWLKRPAASRTASGCRGARCPDVLQLIHPFAVPLGRGNFYAHGALAILWERKMSSEGEVESESNRRRKILLPLESQRRRLRNSIGASTSLRPTRRGRNQCVFLLQGCTWPWRNFLRETRGIGVESRRRGGGAAPGISREASAQESLPGAPP